MPDDDELEELETTTTAPTPGPAGRLQRTAGQVGGAVILLDLVIAFGWLGADDWTPAQTTAVTTAVVFVIAGLHNLANYLVERRGANQAATTSEEPALVAPRPLRARTRGN